MAVVFAPIIAVVVFLYVRFIVWALHKDDKMKNKNPFENE